MKILFVSSEYPPQTGYGGIGTYTRNAAQGLAIRGHQVEVIALSEKKDPYEYFDGQVKIHRIGPGHFPLPGGRFLYPFRRWCYNNIFNSLVRMAWAKSVQEKYNMLCQQTRFDIIETAECGAEAYYLFPKHPTRLVVRLHTPWEMAARLDQINQKYFDIKKTGAMERKTTKRAHGISSPTRALKKILEKRWGLKDVVWYPNPMDTLKFTQKHGQGDYIIYTGRIEYRKGVHVLLKAYARLLQEGVENPLMLVGAPFGEVKQGLPYERIIIDLIDQLGLKEKVIWIRNAGREAVMEKLQQARVAAYPSIWENFPYACLEAMASGLPVVAARCGGYEEMIIDGKSGLLFKPLHHEELAAMLKRILSNDQLAADLGQAGRRRVVEEFSIESICIKAENFYTGILKK
jgi:glycosyltransferase involved in cell wall biosynthesis